MVLVGSRHVYAPVGRDDPIVGGDAPLGPVMAYGKTKLAAGRRLFRAVEATAVDGLVARTFKHAGPRQNARLMLPEWCVQVAHHRGGSLRVLNLDSHFDLTDVRDVVRAYRMLAVRGRCGQAYNVGSGRSRRSGDVIRRLCQAAGIDCPVVEMAPRFRQEPIADIARLQRLTGWRPEIPLETTLSDTLAFWREKRSA